MLAHLSWVAMGVNVMFSCLVTETPHQELAPTHTNIAQSTNIALTVVALDVVEQPEVDDRVEPLSESSDF